MICVCIVRPIFKKIKYLQIAIPIITVEINNREFYWSGRISKEIEQPYGQYCLQIANPAPDKPFVVAK